MTNNHHFENESSLFCLLQQGNEAAFERIYKRYWVELFNAAYKRLPEKEKCQDIIQNVFTDLWLRRESLSITNPTAYLHTAVRFQVLKTITRNARNNHLGDTFLNELISPLGSDGRVLEKEAQLLIKLYIDTLSKKQKKIFCLHFYDGLTAAKIATDLDLSQKTVRNQISMVSQGLKFRLTHLFSFVFLIFTIRS